jgi:ribosomal RNA assembly protein
LNHENELEMGSAGAGIRTRAGLRQHMAVNASGASVRPLCPSSGTPANNDICNHEAIRFSHVLYGMGKDNNMASCFSVGLDMSEKGTPGKLPVPVDPSKIGLLIGKDGANKLKLEEAFNVTIEVKPDEGVAYIGPREGATLYNVYMAEKALKAISIGFGIEEALLLKDDTYDLDVIDLREVARNREDLIRIKARVIGAGGRFRKTLEDMTGAKIVVGEKLIGIIGDFEQCKIAKEALTRLVSGQSHQAVMKFLERHSFELRRRRMELWERIQGI